MTDWGALYAEHVEALAGLASDLDPEDLARSVPATPAWTVHDVLAHLAGGPADSMMGRTDGAPGPAWTARHVGERAELPVEVLLEELRSHQDWVAQWAAEVEQPGIVWDMAVHHADLHEALGRHRLDEHLWRPVLDQVAGRVPAPVWAAGVEDYEVFRAVFSRRTPGELRAWGTGLSDGELEAIGVFGPRED